MGWDAGLSTIVVRGFEFHCSNMFTFTLKLFSHLSLPPTRRSDFSLGGWVVEIVSEVPAEKYLSGRIFVQINDGGGDSSSAATVTSNAPAAPRFQTKLKAKKKKNKTDESSEEDDSVDEVGMPILDFSGRKRKLQLRNAEGQDVAIARKAAAPRWKHSPTAEDALVLNQTPADACLQTYVVVDPFLARQLRPHQVEGVRFLYECVMGLRDPNHQGAILGDEMGLGKVWCSGHGCFHEMFLVIRRCFSIGSCRPADCPGNHTRLHPSLGRPGRRPFGCDQGHRGDALFLGAVLAGRVLEVGGTGSHPTGDVAVDVGFRCQTYQTRPLDWRDGRAPRRAPTLPHRHIPWISSGATPTGSHVCLALPFLPAIRTRCRSRSCGTSRAHRPRAY